MSKGIFVTGTDTGVGKTFVAAGAIKAMKKRDLSVCPMKPVETGCRVSKGLLIPEDTMHLIHAAGIQEPIDMINPYRFRQPLAPSVAAEGEGTVIRKKRILNAYKEISSKYDMTVVEGAGGIMVPISRNYFFLDMASDLKLPLIIVARPGLGTINHTLLTVEAARNRGIKVSGVIINYSVHQKRGLPEKTNPDVIERTGRVPVLGIIPYSVDSSSQKLKGRFERIVERMLD